MNIFIRHKIRLPTKSCPAHRKQGVPSRIAIIFDGALPKSKRETRRARLQGYVEQLLLFQSRHADLSKLATVVKDRNIGPNDSRSSRARDKLLQPQEKASFSQPYEFKFDLDALTTQPLPAKLNALPAPPFLVSAIAEALLSDKDSRYANITYLVPGEADGFCAALARENTARKKKGRSVVLTSDSDLLVYDLGVKNGSKHTNVSSSSDDGKDGGDDGAATVMFFRSISFTKSDDESTIVLKGKEFDPPKIASRLGMPSLIKFAFAVSQRPTFTLQNNVHYANSISENAADFKAFKESYVTPPSLLFTDGFPCQQMHGSSIKAFNYGGCIIDTRLSELLYQILKPNGQIDGGNVEIYLPFLYEDPQRSSAWDCGDSVRLLAYSIIKSCNREERLVVEYCRHGKRLVEKTMQDQSVDRIISSLIHFGQNMKDWRKSFVVLNDPCRWRLYAIYNVCQYLLLNGKPMPPEEDLRLLFLGRFIKNSWDFLHLSAQVQAALYSLRLLRQAIDICCLTLRAAGSKMAFPVQVINNLIEETGPCPKLDNLFSAPNCKKVAKWCDVERQLFKRLEYEKPPAIRDRLGENRFKEKRRPHADMCAVHPSFKVANAFEILSLE